MIDILDEYIMDQCEYTAQKRHNHSQKSYLDWKSCLQTNWEQKEAEEMLEELNLWCYFQRGPVSPNSYTPRCIQDHVFLQDTQILNNTNRSFHRRLKIVVYCKSYQDLSVWGKVLTPNQILPYGTWAAERLSSHSLHLRKNQRKHKFTYDPPYYLWVSAAKAERWRHWALLLTGGTILQPTQSSLNSKDREFHMKQIFPSLSGSRGKGGHEQADVPPCCVLSVNGLSLKAWSYFWFNFLRQWLTLD